MGLTYKHCQHVAIALMLFGSTHYYASFDDQVHSWSKSIAELFHLINTKSYNPISLDNALPKALNTLINSQDSYCRFLGPREYQDLVNTTQGEFFGIGVTVGRKKNTEANLIVFDVIANSPAAKQGLCVNDKITAINGKPVANLTTQEAAELLKGQERHSSVTLVIKRNNKTITITCKRDLIKEEHVHCYFFPEHAVLYCSLSLFSNQAKSDLEGAIKKVALPKLKGIIIDLRDNPGGVLQAAVNCASLFLEPNSLVTVTKDRNNKLVQEFYTQQKPLVPACPKIILVNGQTASSAELFAGALRNHSMGRAPKSPGHVFLLGTQTLGKGSVQEVIPLAQKCALCLTTYMYHLPDLTSINKIGISPDFIVDKKINVRPKSIDKQLLKQNFFETDHQICCALQILALFNLAHQHFPSAINTHDKATTWLKKSFLLNDKLNYEKI